jgi:hypothetical protein
MESSSRVCLTIAANLLASSSLALAIVKLIVTLLVLPPRDLRGDKVAAFDPDAELDRYPSAPVYPSPPSPAPAVPAVLVALVAPLETLPAVQEATPSTEDAPAAVGAAEYPLTLVVKRGEPLVDAVAVEDSTEEAAELDEPETSPEPEEAWSGFDAGTDDAVPERNGSGSIASAVLRLFESAK